jgi:hypothetical protein
LSSIEYEEHDETDPLAETAEMPESPTAGPELSDVGIHAIQGMPSPPLESTASEVERVTPMQQDSETALTSSEVSKLEEQQAIEKLQQIEGIRPEVWQDLSESDRLDTLQGIESQMAALHGRPPAEIRVYPDPPGEYGYYDPSTNEIWVSDQHLENDAVHEVVNTAVHEGRHAYQEYALANPGFHDNMDEVEEWRENLQADNYLSADEYGQELYEGQPVEADAWSYGQTITDGVYGRKDT